MSVFLSSDNGEFPRAGAPACLDFLAARGEMAGLIRNKDWSETPLGPIDAWPQGLRTVVSLCLASNFPINIIWGPQHVQIYNDGYRGCCGDAHPRALGENYRVTWASAWPAIGESFERALAGETMYLENRRMFLPRLNGSDLEETFFTFSHSPIRNESGDICGLLHPVTETTASMLAERRNRVLRDLSASLAFASDETDAARRAIEVLHGFEFDLPFVLYYALDSAGDYRLAGHFGIEPEMAAVPAHVARDAMEPWPFAEALSDLRIVKSDRLGTLLDGRPCGPYEEPPRMTFVLPIDVPSPERSPAVIVAGVSSRLRLTDDYRGFYELLRVTVGGALSMVRTREDERRRAERLVREALQWVPQEGSDEVDSPAEMPAGISASTHARRTTDRPRAKVLLADDNADMRAYVRGLLRHECELRTVGDGEAALAAMREQKPDLVIVDTMMPVLDGFGLLKAIRGDHVWHDIPVIMLSAHAGEESRLEGLEAGADDYLVKPFSARELVARVTINLEMASTRRHEKSKLQTRRGILEMVAGGAPIDKTLDALMLTLEAHEAGMRCGILIVTDDGKHFRRGSGPHLPEVYHRAFDGAPIGEPWLSSCAEAAARCTAVKVPDVVADTRYGPQWRELLLACDIRACRSTPVCGRDGRVLASIAMCYDQPRDPDPTDYEVIDMATHLAAIAIEHDAMIATLRKQEQRRALLIHELNHRVKNTLAVVQALVVQTLRGARGLNEARDALDARLISLSNAHDLLTAEHWQGGDLAATVRTALSIWCDGGGPARCHMHGEPLWLRPKALLALSMAVHELATNAMKYGALSNDTGMIDVCWSVEHGASGMFRFHWVEHGGPEVKPPERRGFGSRLIERGLAVDVNGEARLEFPLEGLEFTLAAPLQEIEGTAAG